METLYGTAVPLPVPGTPPGRNCWSIFPGGRPYATPQIRNIAGGAPTGGLLYAKDGGLYWAMSTETPQSGGIIGRLSALGVLGTLYTFSTQTPCGPAYNLVQGTDGALYGVTLGISLTNRGAVYWISTNGLLTTLAYFPNGGASRWGTASPNDGLTLGPDGCVYGTTTDADPVYSSSVYRLSNGVFTNLYRFRWSTQTTLAAGVTLDPDGALYGVTMGALSTESSPDRA